MSAKCGSMARERHTLAGRVQSPVYAEPVPVVAVAYRLYARAAMNRKRRPGACGAGFVLGRRGRRGWRGQGTAEAAAGHLLLVR